MRHQGVQVWEVQELDPRIQRQGWPQCVQQAHGYRAPPQAMGGQGRAVQAYHRGGAARQPNIRAQFKPPHPIPPRQETEVVAPGRAPQAARQVRDQINRQQSRWRDVEGGLWTITPSADAGSLEGVTLRMH